MVINNLKTDTSGKFGSDVFSENLVLKTNSFFLLVWEINKTKQKPSFSTVIHNNNEAGKQTHTHKLGAKPRKMFAFLIQSDLFVCLFPHFMFWSLAVCYSLRNNVNNVFC